MITITDDKMNNMATKITAMMGIGKNMGFSEVELFPSIAVLLDIVVATDSPNLSGAASRFPRLLRALSAGVPPNRLGFGAASYSHLWKA
jgi:hypothetical protein